MNLVKALPARMSLLPFGVVLDAITAGNPAERLPWFMHVRAAIEDNRLRVRDDMGFEPRPGTLGDKHGIDAYLLCRDVGDWLIDVGFEVTYADALPPLAHEHRRTIEHAVGYLRHQHDKAIARRPEQQRSQWGEFADAIALLLARFDEPITEDDEL